MTDTPNIGLKKYGVADPANLITGYNVSMDTLDTVIKQSQDDIDNLQDSIVKKVDVGTGITVGRLRSYTSGGQYYFVTEWVLSSTLSYFFQVSTGGTMSLVKSENGVITVIKTWT